MKTVGVKPTARKATPQWSPLEFAPCACPLPLRVPAIGSGAARLSCAKTRFAANIKQGALSCDEDSDIVRVRASAGRRFNSDLGGSPSRLPPIGESDLLARGGMHPRCIYGGCGGWRWVAGCSPAGGPWRWAARLSRCRRVWAVCSRRAGWGCVSRPQFERCRAWVAPRRGSLGQGAADDCV